MTFQKKNLGMWIVMALAGLGIVFSFFTDGAWNMPEPKTASEVRHDRIKKAFSAYDGSHRNLEDWVKRKMNDPKSYEHVETKYREVGKDSIFVIMQFRGKNGFGGVVKNTATCYTNLDGKILGGPAILN